MLGRPLHAARSGASLAQRAMSSVPSSSSAQKPRTPAEPPAIDPSLLHRTIVPTTDVRRHPDYPNRFPDQPVHKHINHEIRVIQNPPSEKSLPERMGGDDFAKSGQLISAITGLDILELRNLVRKEGSTHPVVQMTTKGKQVSHYAFMIAGDPKRGLVGVGRGKAEEMGESLEGAFRKATLSMDYVPKFENRTLWGQGKDLEFKWRSTKVIMRARPPGFGLQVPRVLHNLFTACGIRDASATIEGSRNPSQVLHAAIQILHGGANPPGLGSGNGHKGRREDKGAGMRTVPEIQRQRGRWATDISHRR
ncbi:37S ribosomal protein S5, mitochondrial [Vanrija pseudolonga]|uniref:37S ribosomal protein S5, mitochondrial n=1 Tax=Vanrija pseudolonga TaxID=143232 RepID=A0AAF0YCR6_9TREE|nr:37S ribosomal protein S5, mitochondrial [Vanrija pseudolonga]